MKVNTTQQTQVSSKKDEVLKKLESKFGKKFGPKEPKAQAVDSGSSKVDIAKAKKKQGVTNSTEKSFGDIDINDPKNPATREKLKTLLSSGAFQFSSKERSALSEILES
jgi:hypothetical protein